MSFVKVALVILGFAVLIETSFAGLCGLGLRGLGGCGCGLGLRGLGGCGLKRFGFNRGCGFGSGCGFSRGCDFDEGCGFDEGCRFGGGCGFEEGFNSGHFGLGCGNDFGLRRRELCIPPIGHIPVSYGVPAPTCGSYGHQCCHERSVTIPNIIVALLPPNHKPQCCSNPCCCSQNSLPNLPCLPSFPLSCNRC